MYNSSSVPFQLPQSIFMKIYCAYLVGRLLWLDFYESWHCLVPHWFFHSTSSQIFWLSYFFYSNTCGPLCRNPLVWAVSLLNTCPQTHPCSSAYLKS